MNRHAWSGHNGPLRRERVKRAGAPGGLVFCVIMSVVAAAYTSPLGEVPHLEVDMEIDPTTIYQWETGTPDTATIALSVMGEGEAEIVSYTVDVVLVIDKSGSMSGSKLTNAKLAAKTLVDQLKPTDQSCLVSFATEAKLEQRLTYEHWRTRGAIDGLRDGGWTAMGDGIDLAQDEIDIRGRSDSPHVMIVLSDGESNEGMDPIDAADAAKAKDTIIYTIGLGKDADEDVLKQVATSPDHYYYAPDANELIGIYEEISEQISNYAGVEVVVSHKLQYGLYYVPFSFSKAPTLVSGMATWNVGNVKIGDTWTVTFDIYSTQCGYGMPVIELPDSGVDYVTHDGAAIKLEFPQKYINVHCPIMADFTWEPQMPYEGQSVQFTDTTPSRQADVVSWDWDFGDGSPHSDLQNPTHIYSDNGDYDVTMEVVYEDGETGNLTESLTIENAPPTVELNMIPIEVGVFLRIAGEKWHDVSIEMYENNDLVAKGNLTRYPGSPNRQMLNLTSLDIEVSRRYEAVVRYTPEDDPVNGQPNGANPCWIILNFSGQVEVWLHHTFNVRHPETYLWEVDLTGEMYSHGMRFEGIVKDAGGDDLTLQWDFGDGTTNTSFYPNFFGTCPVEIKETVAHSFPGQGSYIVTLTAVDDDGGIGSASISLVFQRHPLKVF